MRWLVTDVCNHPHQQIVSPDIISTSSCLELVIHLLDEKSGLSIFHNNHNIRLNTEQDSCENLNISSMDSSLVLASLIVAAVLASEFEAGEGGEQGQPRHRQFRFSDPVRLGWNTGNMAILVDNIGNIGR